MTSLLSYNPAGPLPSLVPCPHCGAAFMDACRTVGGGYMASAHERRWRAAGEPARFSLDRRLEAASREYACYMLNGRISQAGRDANLPVPPHSDTVGRMFWWRDALNILGKREVCNPRFFLHGYDLRPMLDRYLLEFADFGKVIERAMAVEMPRDEPEPHVIGDAAARANRSKWKVYEGGPKQ